VADKLEVILDGGVRRGTHVLKALALAPRRARWAAPYLYGLAAGGEARRRQGVEHSANRTGARDATDRLHEYPDDRPCLGTALLIELGKQLHSCRESGCITNGFGSAPQLVDGPVVLGRRSQHLRSPDRQYPGAKHQADLGLSDAQLGLLTGTAFGLFYAVLGIPLGRLADRVNRVKLMATVLVLWSGLTILCGMAGNFLQLLVARMGVGVGEAGSQPASTALVADLFEPARRTSAMSTLLVSASAGGFLGLALAGTLRRIGAGASHFLSPAPPDSSWPS